MVVVIVKITAPPHIKQSCMGIPKGCSFHCCCCVLYERTVYDVVAAAVIVIVAFES